MKRVEREQAKPEWHALRCNAPSSFGLINDNQCVPLKRVLHIAHVAQAQRIITDGFVSASLVRDESRLNQSRVAVSWLSANSWAHGSFYGNVQFTMDWEQVIRGRRLYWVEAIPYGTTAYRFLITDQVLAQSDLVRSYDPKTADGPVICRDETWYWNSTYTSEFMVAADLSLDAFSRIDFVNHHPQHCKGTQQPCPDMKRSSYEARLLTLSYIFANSLHTVDHMLRQEIGGHPLHEVNQFVIWMMQLITNHVDRFRGRKLKSKHRNSLTCGLLSLWSCRRFEDAALLASMFPDKETLYKALCRAIADHFHLQSYDPRSTPGQ